MSLRSVPKIAFCRYCGTMTMWYRQYHRTWLWFCHSRIVVSPSCGLGGSTPGETASSFTNQRRNGRAFSSLTARGGGLPIGVIEAPRYVPRYHEDLITSVLSAVDSCTESVHALWGPILSVFVRCRSMGCLFRLAGDAALLCTSAAISLIA